jgi:hypothetical protein
MKLLMFPKPEYSRRNCSSLSIDPKIVGIPFPDLIKDNIIHKHFNCGKTCEIFCTKLASSQSIILIFKLSTLE